MAEFRASRRTGQAGSGSIAKSPKSVGTGGVGAGSSGEKVRALVVDDALVIRGMLTRILEAESDIEVVASASDGERALQALRRHHVDVVVLDIEMPKMDGLEALPLIVKEHPGIQVLMASTLTTRNAEISLKAMELGAADYVPKPSSTGDIRGKEDFQQELVEKVRTLGRVGKRRKAAPPTSARAPAGAPAVRRGIETPRKEFTLRPAKPMRANAFAIGSSTGGPQALFKVLNDLGSVDQPVFITQHMPPTFTAILAQHIAKSTGRDCREAADGESVQRGRIYLAPGNKHLIVEGNPANARIRLSDDPPENFCRPSVDPMLRSLSKVYGGNLMVAILTGMGSDGAKGAEQVVAGGGQILAQDEATSVVWGMPGAVAMRGVCSGVLPLDKLGGALRRYAA